MMKPVSITSFVKGQWIEWYINRRGENETIIRAAILRGNHGRILQKKKKKSLRVENCKRYVSSQMAKRVVIVREKRLKKNMKDSPILKSKFCVYFRYMRRCNFENRLRNDEGNFTIEINYNGNNNN